MSDRTTSSTTSSGRRRIGVMAVAVALAATLVLASCSKTEDDAGKTTDSKSVLSNDVALVDEGPPEEGGSLSVGVPAETDSYSPSFGQWTESGMLVASSFFEPLFVYDKDSNLVPWLAEGAVPNDDHTVWTITLREGIKFHDGTDFNAEAWATGFGQGVTKGLSAVAMGDMIQSVEATGTYEVTVTTTRSWASFVNVLAGQNAAAASLVMTNDAEPKSAKPVGTGAFEFVDWVRDSKLTVKKFDGYWGGPCSLDDPGEQVKAMCESVGVELGTPNGPFVDEIEFLPLVDGQARSSALAARDVDMVLTQQISDMASLRDQYDIVADFDSQKGFVQLNHGTAPFNNEHARKALAYGTDYQAIIDLVSEGEPIVRDTSPFSASGKWGLPEGETGFPTYDPTKAAEELAAYKADTGQDLTFALSGVASQEELTVLQALQEQWQRLGAKAEIQTIEQVVFINTLVGGQYQAAIVRNYGYPDPDSNTYFFAKKSAQPPLFINFAQYATDSTEAALETGRTTTDQAERKAAYDSIAKERNAAITELWLYDTPYALVADPRVHGLNWFRVLPWGAFLPKPYFTSIWVEVR